MAERDSAQVEDSLFTTIQEQLARRLFELGAIQIDTQKGFELKLHEQHPEAPMSPFYMNLRALGHKDGQLGSGEFEMIAQTLFEEASQKGFFFREPVILAGIPDAGEPIVDALEKVLTQEWGVPTESIPRIWLNKVDVDGKREIRGVNRFRAEPNDTSRHSIILVDDLVTRAHSKLEPINYLTVQDFPPVSNVLVLIDREQGGAAGLIQDAVTLSAVFTVRKLMMFYRDEGLVTEQDFEVIMTYLQENS